MMAGFGMSGGSGIASVDHIQVVALYEVENGRIVHMHMVTSLGGATPPTHEEAIAEAKELATRRNPNVHELGVALSNDAEHGRTPHQIDPKTKEFVPIPKEAA